jgi:iron complex outermembrane receptor protein
MKFYKYSPLLLSLIVAAASVSPVIAADDVIESAPLVVTATRHEFSESDAPYPAELYNYEDIEQSGSTSLYDFLNHNTSITIMPSYGNPFAQKIDMRGYGIGDGYQNIVVTVDGRRLNNIDMVPQLLSAIPLSNIERIEITKGSGSVVYGDGATAGAIHIHTRDAQDISASITTGNYGLIGTSISAGLNDEILSLSVTADSTHLDGFSDADISGKRDSANNNSLHTKLTVLPTDSLEVRLIKERSRIDNRYPGYMTQSEFDSNPAQNSGNTYTYQQYDTNNSGLGLTADLSDRFKLNLDHSNETKHSDYNSGSWGADYDYTTSDLSLTFDQGNINIITGVQSFDGSRIGSDNTTSKNNSSYYIQSHFKMSSSILSLGGRQEKVSYTYDPTVGATLKDSHSLNSYDIGINHRYNSTTSLFGNYNLAFQAPDIDRFFSTDWVTMITSFNTFIDPAISKTINIGINHKQGDNRLKLTLFRTNLENEIYLEPITYSNTNIDRSHKYGVEIEDSHQFNKAVTASINYAYTRAIIDSEDSGAGAYDGKELPGVSNHNATISVSYRPSVRSTYNINHTYRSTAYAANDFANTFTQKQRAFNSTDIGYSYQMQKTRLSIKITNLLNNAHGLWVADDVVYPVNFTRNIELGLKAAF